MSELIIRRVVIACDATCDIQDAVDEAAALAVRWNAALHGVFLEDENLYRLAGLPFGRQVTLPFAASQALDLLEVEKLSMAMGAAMRRMGAEAAAQRGLGWSFDVVRGFPNLAALSEFEGDLLVVQGAARPFIGSWRPRSSWNNMPEDYPRTVLIRREPRSPAGIVVILLEKHEDRERILLSAFAIANPEDEVVMLLREGTDAAVEAAKRIVESLNFVPRRKIRWELAAVDMPEVLLQIGRLEPRLVVVEAGEDEKGQIVHELLAGTRCDVLVVR